MVNDLDHEGIDFPVSKRIIARLKIFINIFCYENDLWYMFSEIWLETNGKQSAKLESGSIKFKNYFKQIAILFKLKSNWSLKFVPSCNV